MIRSLAIVLVAAACGFAQGGFVTSRGSQFYADGKPYYFVGANYWYGGLLGKRGIKRLRQELDFLQSRGVTNLRLMAGAEGSGLINGVTRVGPTLQPEQGKFDASVLDGLDLVLAEMAKRRMRAVIFFSNNWEWSGGFQQYLIWNGVISREWLTRKPTWDELRDLTAKFYFCKPCKAAYQTQVEYVLARRNSINGRRYVDDPTIFAWELANEPRPMRPAANDEYKRWISGTAAFIKSKDKRHLVTLGHEGWIGTQDVALFEAVHADRNVNYLTIHIWPKNWGWFEDGKMEEQFDAIDAKTADYIRENLDVAKRLKKPLVLEEFGLPRDGQRFDPFATTRVRDKYFESIFGLVRKIPEIAGANFWAFGGIARPIKGQTFWKPGDAYMGDPPMEEQGLNSVFTTDRSTWAIVYVASKRINASDKP
jgi:mannan endo-1,4-beta-mannosidase